MSCQRTTRQTRKPKQSKSSKPMSLGGALIILAIFAFIFLLQEGYLDSILEPEPEAPPPAQAPQNPGDTPQSVETDSLIGFAQGPVQVYFTRPQYPERAPNRIGGLDETIAAEIDRARNTVDLASFDFDLDDVTASLQRAHERGVRVRMVIDGENLETPEVAEHTGTLQDAGIPITFDRRSAFMHNKFVIIDSSVVWTGSWNVTVNDTYRNNNNMLRFTDQRIANNFTRKFDLLFDGRGGPGNRANLRYTDVDLDGFAITTAFSPDSDITGDVVRALNNAETSVDFMAFAFTSDPIADAVIAAEQRGVTVRGVMERRNASATGSELPKLQDANIDVLVDGNCYIMHSKTFIIDGHTVITGSFNWTAAAQNSNDENVVTIRNDWLAQRYAEEFTRVYQQAQNPTRCGS